MPPKSDHHYTCTRWAAARPHLACSCGHVEPFDGDADLSSALERLNAHIRGSYSDEEWEEFMQNAKLATLDSATGVLTTTPKGAAS